MKNTFTDVIIKNINNRRYFNLVNLLILEIEI
jgi:hypothetical protein